jgi:hypothetical protein
MKALITLPLTCGANGIDIDTLSARKGPGILNVLYPCGFNVDVVKARFGKLGDSFSQERRVSPSRSRTSSLLVNRRGPISIDGGLWIRPPVGSWTFRINRSSQHPDPIC